MGKGSGVITLDEFDEIVRLVCPHCRKGDASRFRADTKEHVHDTTDKSVTSHTICWATSLKTSRFAENK